MRGDAALSVRLLLFGQGRAGLVVAGGGTLAMSGALLPWYELVATVTMLGADDERAVAVVRGAPDLVRGGWVLVLGLGLVVLGVALGIDRPPRRARTVITLSAVVIAAIAVGSLLTRPSVTTLSRKGGADLLALEEELPVGIELAFATELARGSWLVLAGALIALGGAIGALQRTDR